MASESDYSHRPDRARRWLRHLVSYWTLIVAVSGLALLTLADVGEDVGDESSLLADNAVRTWILHHRTPAEFHLAFAVTWLGSPIVMVLVALAAAAWFWRNGGRRKAGVVVAAPAIGGLLSELGKLVYARSRPAGAIPLGEHTYAFPSGHASTSAAVIVTLAYVLAREKIISWPVAIVLGGSLPLLVGLSRLALDVHWVTDVVGGWSVGLLVAALSAAAYERLRTDAPSDAEIEQVVTDGAQSAGLTRWH
jgi:membrane-associated phospholipid phosphatase